MLTSTPTRPFPRKWEGPKERKPGDKVRSFTPTDSKLCKTKPKFSLSYSRSLEVACENIRFSSLFAAGGVSHGGTSATQRQKFHTDDANQCLLNKSGRRGVPNVNLFNFRFLLIDFGKVLVVEKTIFHKY